jgi:hypothetical protein
LMQHVGKSIIYIHWQKYDSLDLIYRGYLMSVCSIINF